MRQHFTPKAVRVAYFVSPHGYGHAARASAVMAEVHKLDPAVRFEIFTLTPRWFFEESLPGPFGYHSLLTDIGLVQKTPLVEDLVETVVQLDGLLPFDRPHIEGVARQVTELGCRLCICDIAPMGIVVSKAADSPSVLVENFTWDWIYRGYVKHSARLHPHITYLQEVFDSADYRVQTEPVCQHRQADLVTQPVSRMARTSPRQIRHQLGIPGSAKVVMITLGGIPWRYTFLEELTGLPGIYFIIPGGDEQARVRENLVLLPHRSPYFHPDLVNASDAVIGKAGYSTLAETYHAGVPYGYVERPNFRESRFLADYIQREMKGIPISEIQFENGEWLALIEDLLSLPRIRRVQQNGANQAAEFICGLLDHRNRTP